MRARCTRSDWLLSNARSARARLRRVKEEVARSGEPPCHHTRLIRARVEDTLGESQFNRVHHARIEKDMETKPKISLRGACGEEYGLGVHWTCSSLVLTAGGPSASV